MKVMEDQFAKYIAHEKTLKNRELRAILVAKDPHCYWCRRLVNNDYAIAKRNIHKGEHYPDDMATIDHLYDRFDPVNRYRVYPNWENKVLSCFRCNIDRAKERMKQLPKTFLTLRQTILAKRRKLGSSVPRPVFLAENGAA